jgi:hypothetical protein
MNDKPAKIEMVTLNQLCAELKVDPREAGRLLGYPSSRMLTTQASSARRRDCSRLGDRLPAASKAGIRYPMRLVNC